MIISNLMTEVHRLVTEKGWRENIPVIPRSNVESFSEYVFPAYLDLAHSELTEALEAYRDRVWSDTRHDADPPDKPVGVGPELADVIIRVLDMCDIWGIDIEYEIDRVLKYGWTRPYQHGGRTL